jgi:hypothetical protein
MQAQSQVGEIDVKVHIHHYMMKTKDKMPGRNLHYHIYYSKYVQRLISMKE